MALSEFDRGLIAATQGGLPLVPRPYEALGAALGVSAEAVRERLAGMLACGLIRRIGAVPNHYKLGFTANGMTVWDVADERVDELGARVGALPGVSHCYRRPRASAASGRTTCSRWCTAARATRWRSRPRASTALLGDACRGHDILYSTRILKKTGSALVTDERLKPCSASPSTCASCRRGRALRRDARRRAPATPAGPVVIWNLIRRCNLTCKHCYALSADHDYAGELTTGRGLHA